MSLNALVVGAGNIGAFIDTPDDENVLSHAHAYSAHSGFKLAGFVDVDRKRAAEAATLWRCGHFDTLQDAFESQRIDVVSVAVPDDCHYMILKEISAFSPSVVIAEKPITRTMDQAREIESIYRSAKPVVAVNYSRRYVPHFLQLRRRIRNGEFGRYLAGSGYYGKGIVHNGSHLVDLLRFLIDEIDKVDVISGECDFYPDDPSVEALIRFPNGAGFHLQPISCRMYTVFELDLFFERRRIRIMDSGFQIEEQAVANSKFFAGHLDLSPAGVTQTGMGKAMLFLLENVNDSIRGESEIGCTVRDAVRDLEICIAMAASWRQE